MKKLITMLLVLVFALSCVACGGDDFDELNKNKTIILLYNFDGGIGSEWLESDYKAFEELVAEKSYEDGKKGVAFKLDRAMSLNAASMDQSAYNIYFDEVQTNVRNFADKGLLLDLTDTVTSTLTEYDESKSIIDKTDDTYESTLKGSDGKYYGLPYYEWYPGLSYDIDVFNENSLYIAAPTETNYVTVSNYGQDVHFIKNLNGKKSCGNDGLYGTSDDGLPTSMIEFLSLCKRMVDRGVKPFQSAGSTYHNYKNHLVASIWASLAGYDAMRVNYTFDGTIEVITGWTEENLISGINYVKKPTTAPLKITEQNGYEYYNMVERYYALSLLEIIFREGWFNDDCTSDTVDHTGAQYNFVAGPYKEDPNPMGFLIEGSYWYKEALRSGAIDDVADFSGNSERNIGWLSLPTSMTESVTEGNGRPVAYLESSHSYMTVNKASLKGNAGLEAAIKDFIRFMYSDARLSNFTAITGIPKGGMNYQLTDKDKNSLTSFQSTIWDVRKNCKVVYSGADNQTFINKQSAIEFQANIGIFRPYYKGTQYADCFSPFSWNNDCTARGVFEAGLLSEANW